MTELGEVPQSPATKPNLTNRVLGALKGVAKTFEIPTDPTPVNKINARTVASKIDSSIFNPLLPEEKRFANGFDIGHVLSAMNYTVTWIDDDFREAHPEVYQITRQKLQELVHRGALKMEPLEKPTTHGETIWYKVTDEAKLKEIVSKSGTSK